MHFIRRHVCNISYVHVTLFEQQSVCLNFTILISLTIGIEYFKGILMMPSRSMRDKLFLTRLEYGFDAKPLTSHASDLWVHHRGSLLTTSNFHKFLIIISYEGILSKRDKINVLFYLITSKILRSQFHNAEH